MPTYISSDGSEKEIGVMATSYIKNAIAKINRNREEGVEDAPHTQDNLNALEKELASRGGDQA